VPVNPEDFCLLERVKEVNRARPADAGSPGNGR